MREPAFSSLPVLSRKTSSDLADRELREVGAGPRDVNRRLEVARLLPLHQVGQGVMDNRPPVEGGPHFERLHPAVLGETGSRRSVGTTDPAPPTSCVHGVERTTRSGSPNSVYLSARRQDVARWPLARRRHVIRVAEGRPPIDPADHGVDLGVAQRNVVGELANAHRRIDVPRRHDACRHLLADGARPWPHLPVSDKRHRRHAAGPVARLAASLKDRRDVAGERRVIRAGGLGAGGLRDGGGCNEQRDDSHERERPRLHSIHLHRSGDASGVSVSRRSLYKNIHVGVGPAALESARHYRALPARIVPCQQAQNVVAGRAEGDGGSGAVAAPDLW